MKNEDQAFAQLLTQLDLDNVRETTWDPAITKKRSHDLIDLIFQKSFNSRITSEDEHNEFLSKFGAFLAGMYSQKTSSGRKKMELTQEERARRAEMMKETARAYWNSPEGKARKAKAKNSQTTAEPEAKAKPAKSPSARKRG
jgi:hypothetical protein